MDYGEAVFVKSKFFNDQLLIVTSERHVGCVYKFHKKSEKYFACASCKELGKSRIITVVDGRIVGRKHPEDDHHADCRPVSQTSVDVLDIDRNMRCEVHTTGKRPREAFSDAVNSIPKRFKSTDEQKTVIVMFPTYSEIRGSLYKHHATQNISVPNPCDIPEELCTTVRGKSVGPLDENYLETFLLHSGQGGKLLIFSADTELKTLSESEYIVCDGTFEMAPNSSFQLYTLQGFYGEEGLPLVWALLPNKSHQTYVELFSTIRQAFADKFCNERKRHVFLTDFETAAINAITDIFPESTVKGCTFHFRQALMRKIQELGLRPAYSSGDPTVQSWIRQIMGLTLLPEVFIPMTWQRLKHPPPMPDSELMMKLQAFSAYFKRTWVFGHLSPKLWCHFDNAGPRTTNLAEGWHNSLNYSFGMPHPSARTFLNWLQKCQFRVQCREIQLQAGRPAKQQSIVYRDLNKRIADAKLRFGLRSGHIFLNLILHPSMWPALEGEIECYLRHVSYLIAGK